ncbi:hypothetical protein NY78_3950 [Desulfovibrio sp. TomC]|nr:hypothetical protein NY78_3950 [Desulfovibrio sp. TomC]
MDKEGSMPPAAEGQCPLETHNKLKQVRAALPSPGLSRIDNL